MDWNLDLDLDDEPPPRKPEQLYAMPAGKDKARKAAALKTKASERAARKHAKKPGMRHRRHKRI